MSDVSKFKELIGQKGYPQNQNVIRLDNLPSDSCSEDIVRCLFPGKFKPNNPNKNNSHVSVS